MRISSLSSYQRNTDPLKITMGTPKYNTIEEFFSAHKKKPHLSEFVEEISDVLLSNLCEILQQPLKMEDVKRRIASIFTNEGSTRDVEVRFTTLYYNEEATKAMF